MLNLGEQLTVRHPFNNHGSRIEDGALDSEAG